MEEEKETIYVSLVSYFVCECHGCGKTFPAAYNSEFLDLLEEIPPTKKDNYFMSHKDCEHVPIHWKEYMHTKHFVLYKSY